MGWLRRQPQIRQQVCQGLPGQTLQQRSTRTCGHAQYQCGHKGKNNSLLEYVRRSSGFMLHNPLVSTVPLKQSNNICFRQTHRLMIGTSSCCLTPKVNLIMAVIPFHAINGLVGWFKINGKTMRRELAQIVGAFG